LSSLTTVGSAGVTAATTTAVAFFAVSLGSEELVETSATVKTSTCKEAADMASHPSVPPASQTSLAGELNIPSSKVKANCRAGGSCARRLLSASLGSFRRELSSVPAFIVDYAIKVPANTTSSSIVNTISAINTSSFTLSLLSSLASTPFSGTHISVTAFSAPSTSRIFPGYQRCYIGKSCQFHLFNYNAHFVMHSVVPISVTACAQACVADSTCEVFEHMVEPFQPSCVFWKNGACNVLDADRTYPIEGHTHLQFCIKDGARETFNPHLTLSNADRILCRWSAMLSIFLIVAVTR